MLEIFQSTFMIRAMLAGLVVAAIAPLIGIFLVVRRYSLMADTLAHVSLAGVATGILTGINPFITALITTILAAFGIEKLRTGRKLYGESVLALFLTGSLAVATVLLSLAHGLNANLLSYLFGSIATVTFADLLLISILGLLVLLTVSLLYKEFFHIALDEELAAASGLPVQRLNLLLVILAAITVSISIRVVGVLLIGALMVIPVITAIQYNLGFSRTLWLAIGLSLFSVITGLIGSYYMNLASGGTIVLVALALFLLSLVLNRKG